MLRHIAWFNEALIEPDPAGGLRSPDERVRRRCLLPAAVLEARGVACSVFGNLHDADPAEISKLLQKLGSEIVVIGAFADPSLLRLARAAKHLGCYIVADFADQAAIGPDFEKLAVLADGIVAGTEAALKILEAGGLSATVIPDADANDPADIVADAWQDCFNALKLNPPACANTNTPPSDGG
jgi:hypothetical protein